MQQHLLQDQPMLRLGAAAMTCGTTLQRIDDTLI
jgi:hypothetical protein